MEQYQLIAVYSGCCKEVSKFKKGTILHAKIGGSHAHEYAKDSHYIHTTDVVAYKDGDVVRSTGGGRFVSSKLYERMNNITESKKELNCLWDILYFPIESSRIETYTVSEDGNTAVLKDGTIIKVDDIAVENGANAEETDNHKAVGLTHKAVDITDNTLEITDNTLEITDNTLEITDNTVEITDNTVEITDNTLEEFDKLVRDEKELALDDYIGITLTDGIWSKGYTDEYISKVSEDNEQDSREVATEKLRIRALMNVKDEFSRLRKQGKSDEIDIDNKSDIKETEDDTDIIEIKAKVELREQSDLNVDTKFSGEGDPNCNICHGDGAYINKVFGMATECICVKKMANKRRVEQMRKDRITALKIVATNGDREVAVRENLVPEHRKDDKFDLNVILKRIADICQEYNLQVSNSQYANYTTALADIDKLIGSGSGLKHSYIIGAPNGFSKTTFANSCIASLNGAGKSMVPYVSLTEIALKLLTESANFKLIRNREFDKITRKKSGEYDWNDYINAYLVFCFLTIPESAEIELSTLKSLLSLRGNKGLATVVFTERPINAYNVSKDIELFLMSDMTTSNKRLARLDRPLKIEIIKTPKSGFGVKKGRDI